MKLFISLFSLIILAGNCSENTSEKQKDNMQNNISIEYEASSRGFYQEIKIAQKQLTVVNDRSGENKKTKSISDSDWSALMQILDAIAIDELEKNYVNADDLKRDAVIPAKLTVSYKENSVANVEFGHGNPPKELQALLTKIEAMANAVDKP